MEVKSKIQKMNKYLRDNWDYVSIVGGISLLTAAVIVPEITSPVYNEKRVPNSSLQVQRLCQLEKKINYYSIRPSDFLDDSEEIIKKTKSALEEYKLLSSDPNLVREKTDFEDEYKNRANKSLKVMSWLLGIGGLPFAIGYGNVLFNRDSCMEKR